MSEMATNGCIIHRDIRHIRLFNDYLTLYKGNEHKAKLVRILETWTNKKRDEWYLAATGKKEQGQPLPEPDFWVGMSFQQFRNFMFETASLDTIKANVAELIKEQHFQRRVNPEDPYGAPQYLLNTKLIQRGLDKIYDPSLSAFVPSLPDTPLPGVKNTPPLERSPLGEGGSLPLPTGENTPLGRGEKHPPSNNRTNNTSKRGDGSVVETVTIAPDGASFLSLYEKLSPEEQEKVKQQLSGKKGKSSTSKKAATEEKQVPEPLTAEEEKRWRYWEKYINARRGGPLRDGGKVINERECLKQLVHEFSDVAIEAIDKYLATEHWKYKKNPCEIGGKALLDESRPTWQLIKDRVQPKQASTPQNGTVKAQTPTRTSTSKTYAEMSNQNPWKGVPGKEQEWERQHQEELRKAQERKSQQVAQAQ